MSDQTTSGDEIEARILEAATRLSTRYGFDKTTMNDIAREAGVAKSTLYLRYKTKDDLFQALLWREARQVMREWVELMRTDPRGCTFSGVYKNGLLVMRRNAFIMALYTRDWRVLGRFLHRPEMQAMIEQRMTMTKAFLTGMQAAGAIRQDIDIAQVAYVINSLQYGILKIDEVIPPEEAPPLDGTMEIMVDMLDAYISPPDGGDAEAGRQVVEQLMTQMEALLDQFDQRQQHNTG